MGISGESADPNVECLLRRKVSGRLRQCSWHNLSSAVAVRDRLSSPPEGHLRGGAESRTRTPGTAPCSKN